MSSSKQRLEVREAKERLRKAYRTNPNPSHAQLKGIAEDVGRSVSSVIKWFERERSSSKTNTPEPTTQRSQAQESLKRSAPDITTNRFAKRPARSTSPERNRERPALTLKSKQPAPIKQPATQPVQPQPQATQPKPVAPQEASSSVVPPPTTPPQAIPSQTTISRAAPLEPKEKEAGPADQGAEADQQVIDNEQSHPFPHAAHLPIAYEGVTKLQHELHCAMFLYYQATQGIPMSYPDSFSR
ncbi:hypothetical protein FS749_000090 [Ceratobasidium sp. UAMH 11750]|nr:hypothetical protein FS749_000090 [Ceratobasidium sp. UAMH 11750]